MKRVYILGACRTPIGKMGGALSSLKAIDLGELVIKEGVKRAGIPIDAVDHVFMGCVLQAGLGQNVARQAAIKAGLPVTTTAQTINIVCGSSLDAVNSAARMIQNGDADIVIAGGMESMSNAPFAVMNARYGYKMGSPMINTPLIDTMVNDGLWEAMNNYHMGITAENVAEQWEITRTELDEFAAESQRKACEAVEAGRFKDEIVPVIIKGRKGDTVINTDEGPRTGTTVESLAKLKPAFKPDGIVTAGNSSGINDGAAAVVLVSENKVREFGIRPETEWLGGALGGVDPSIMGIGPVESTRKLLKKLNMEMEDIDLVEANEAFASQSIAVKRDLNIPGEKLNINGGAIALGHPIGASGCRILVTLIHGMKKNNAEIGLATLCIGGGMGCSTIVRKK
ncbi:acetyl-CoA C-acetyltransferase [Oribacterium sp. NK2B42]|uniref:acetyl-CoA C-acetyltransferase n=1 Tax=Oribacterium sp. NK2B42 TaxID=689781 RepID=UPI000492A87B